PPGRPSGQSIAATCSARALDAGDVALKPADHTFTYSEPEHTWVLIYHVEVTQDGRYELSCRTQDPTIELPQFGVGDDPDLGGLFAKSFGGAAALITLPCCGIVVGAALIVLVAVRRNTYRKRLQAQR